MDDFPWETINVMSDALDSETYKELPTWAKDIYSWAAETIQHETAISVEDKEGLLKKLVLIEAEEIMASAKNRGGSS